MKSITTRGLSTGLIIGIVAIIGIILWLMSSYNGLVSSNEAVNNQWAQVETQYQRRFDLIPNLVASVQGIMKQEREVFANLAEARSHYAGATTVDQKAVAAGQVESALGRLLVITENYPQLRSSENVSTLTAQLEGTENRVSVERGRFNDMVRDYNLSVKRVPGSIFASLFGFHERAYFQADSASATAPKVQL
jgi:LemA protein